MLSGEGGGAGPPVGVTPTGVREPTAGAQIRSCAHGWAFSTLSTAPGAACDGSACDGSACDGSACDGSACDGSACDGSACDGAACDGAACDGAACDGAACDGPGPAGPAIAGAGIKGTTRPATTRKASAACSANTELTRPSRSRTAGDRASPGTMPEPTSFDTTTTLPGRSPARTATFRRGEHFRICAAGSEQVRHPKSEAVDDNRAFVGRGAER